ncbi:hypothetical protein FDECE_14043 [Fusarium decemcellulare]|nr:hypothetical protein FDECE_14043 [Fusarium decemcellulare]
MTSPFKHPHGTPMKDEAPYNLGSRLGTQICVLLAVAHFRPGYPAPFATDERIITSDSAADRRAQISGKGAEANGVVQSVACQSSRQTFPQRERGKRPQTPKPLITERAKMSATKKVDAGPATIQKHSIPASPPSAKRQKPIDDTIRAYDSLGPGSNTSPQDKKIIKDFINLMNGKATSLAAPTQEVLKQMDGNFAECKRASNKARAARERQKEAHDEMRAAEVRLRKIKEDQVEGTLALEQLLTLQQVHVSVFGGDLKEVIQKTEAKTEARQKGLAKAEESFTAFAQTLGKLTKKMKTAETDVARLEEQRNVLSQNLADMANKQRLMRAASLFFKFGLCRAMEALD